MFRALSNLLGNVTPDSAQFVTTNAHKDDTDRSEVVSDDLNRTTPDSAQFVTTNARKDDTDRSEVVSDDLNRTHYANDDVEHTDSCHALAGMP